MQIFSSVNYWSFSTIYIFNFCNIFLSNYFLLIFYLIYSLISLNSAWRLLLLPVEKHNWDDKDYIQDQENNGKANSQVAKDQIDNCNSPHQIRICLANLAIT